MTRDFRPLVFLLPAAVLLRGAWRADSVLGPPQGEGWGRLFVTSQVSRWFSGEASAGWADLLAAPDGRAFWPVDPALQLLAVPLAGILGSSLSLVMLMGILLWLAGAGVYGLARSAGAGVPGAVVGGLLVQLSPFLLDNARDAVLEVAAVGILAIAAQQILRVLRAPSRRGLAVAGGSILLLAATSPYYAVYLALGCVLAIPLTRHWWRAWCGVAGVGALACGLALSPLLLAEGGEDGRLGPRYERGGYQLTPSPLELSDGRPAGPPTRWLPPPDDDAVRPAPVRKGARGPQPMWERLLRRAPGGAVLMGLGLAGLAVRRARPWAALGLVFWLAGPGPGLIGRALRQPVADVSGPLNMLLASFPLTASMGNPSRLLVPAILLGAVAAALVLGRRRGVSSLAVVLVVLEAGLALPGLRLPSSPFHASEPVLTTLEGPTVVFPSGDPPYWYPAVGAKEVLFLAGRAGVPVAYDYGRGGLPADVVLQAQMAGVAGVPLGAGAWKAQPERGAPLQVPDGFRSILVLEDRLPARNRARLRAWLREEATLLAEDEALSAWQLPP